MRKNVFILKKGIILKIQFEKKGCKATNLSTITLAYFSNCYLSYEKCEWLSALIKKKTKFSSCKFSWDRLQSHI
jgi:hypothetical protein